MFSGAHKTPLAMRGVLFFALLFASFQTAFADEPVDLGTIVVEDSSADKQPSLDRTAQATVIKAKDVADPTATIPNMLEQSAGVHVKRYGGLDDFSAISLRGSTAAQVQIYLDDIPLATTQGELTDLSIIPIGMLDKIEVYRGGSPGMIVDSTAGGVIILKTKKKQEKTETLFSASGGSFLTFKGMASRLQSFKKFSYAAAFERSQSKGDFPYKNNMGTTFNTSDDVITKRQNNSFATNSLFTKLLFDTSKTSSVTVENLFFQKGQGIPGLGTFQSTNARLTTWRNLLQISGDKKFDAGCGLSGYANIFFDYLKDELSDPQGEIGLGVQNNNDDTYRVGSDLKFECAPGSHNIVRGFLAGRYELYAPVNYAASPSHGPKSSRATVTTGAEDEIVVLSDRLSIVPSIRYAALFNHLSNQDPSVAVANSYTNTRTNLQLSAKLGARLRLVDEFYFKGNVYRGFRNPTFSEFFGDRGTIVGNPLLSPEKSLNFDVGFSLLHSRDDIPINAALDIVYFRNSVDGLIQFVQTSQFTVRAQNMSDALIQGGEIQLRFNWADRISSYASYTLQFAKDAGSSPSTSGKYLPGRPKNELAAGVSWREKWLGKFGTKLFSDIHYMSGNYLDTQNLLFVENRILLAAGLAAIIMSNFTLSFTMKNIFNEMISDLVGYPLPGRSYWVGAEFKL